MFWQPCTQCGVPVPTRILADSITLIVVGSCLQHGTVELGRVHVDVETADESGGRAPAGGTMELEPALVRAPVTSTVSYKPGPQCGMRIGAMSSCRLPAQHGGPHRD